LLVTLLSAAGWSADALAQPSAEEASSYQSINNGRLRLTRQGMLTLGGWAVGNLALGGYFWATNEGASRYFHQMNVLWNTVNLGLATSGYLGAQPGNAEGLNALETLQAFQSLEKILLFNAGLDVGYVATGLYLRERGRRRDQQRLRGYGRSLLLQGAFLFLFDLGLYAAIHQKQSQWLETERPFALGAVSLPSASGAPRPGLRLRFSP
jgi:hypothetical protein